MSDRDFGRIADQIGTRGPSASPSTDDSGRATTTDPDPTQPTERGAQTPIERARRRSPRRSHTETVRAQTTVDATAEQRDLLRGRGDSIQTPAADRSGDALDPDARPPTREERTQLAEQTPFEADEIVGVSPLDGDRVAVSPTAAARERIARERFESRQRVQRIVGGPMALREFEIDDLEFEATGGGVTARPGRAVRQRRRGQQQEELQTRDRAAARREAADELDVDPGDIELEETETGFVARAEVEREPDRPLADRFEAATGFEVPTESEFLSRPQAAAAGVVGGIATVHDRFAIPSQQTGAVRDRFETPFDIDLPDGESDALTPITGRVDDAVGALDLDDIPSDVGEVTDAFESRTGVDVPTESAVVDPLRRGTVGAAVRVGEAQRDFATDAEFGTTGTDDVRFDFGDVADVGADIAETAGDVNRRFSVSGAGFGTIDPDADPGRRTGLAGVPVAAGPGVATPPGAAIAGAVVVGTAAVGLDQARRRGELGIGSTTTDVQEVEIAETDLAELEPTETARGTGEVGLGSGVGVTEVGLGDFVTETEVALGETDADAPVGTPADDSVVPGEFPLPGRDVPRDPTQDRRRDVDPSEIVGRVEATAVEAIRGEQDSTEQDDSPFVIIDNVWSPTLEEEDARLRRAMREREDPDDPDEIRERDGRRRERLQDREERTPTPQETRTEQQRLVGQQEVEAVEVEREREAEQERQEEAEQTFEELWRLERERARESAIPAQEFIGGVIGQQTIQQDRALEPLADEVAQFGLDPDAAVAGPELDPLGPPSIGPPDSPMLDVARESGVGFEFDFGSDVGLTPEVGAPTEVGLVPGLDAVGDTGPAVDVAAPSGTADVTQTVPMTATATISETAVDEIVVTDTVFQETVEPVEVATPVTTIRPPRRPTTRRPVFGEELIGEGDIGLDAFVEDAVFENPTRDLDEASADIERQLGELDEIGEGFDAP